MLKDLQTLSDLLKGRLTPDSSKEEIEEVGNMTDLINSIDKQFEAKNTELSEVKDMLIKSMKNEGSKEVAKEPTDSDKPKSLEEIAKDVIANDK